MGTSAVVKKLSVLAICLAVASPLFSQEKVDRRLADSTAVLKTIVSKQEVPQNILDKAVCVLVYPRVKKVGVGIGVSYGRGVLSCRTGSDMSGPWSAPAMYT